MKRSYSGYLYIVLCAVIFSTMEVMLKTVHGVFAPMQITCLRFLIGGLLLVPFALRSMKKKGAAFTRADVGFFALTGFLCVAFSMVLYQMAVTYTKASVVAIIFSCNPIFVTMLAYFLLREEIHRNHLIALALELLAVLIIIDPLHASLDPPGALLARGALRGMGRTLAALAADLPGVPSRGVVFFLMIHKRTALLFKNPKSFFSGQAPICIFPHRIRQSMTSEVKRKCATTMTAPACG